MVRWKGHEWRVRTVHPAKDPRFTSVNLDRPGVTTCVLAGEVEPLRTTESWGCWGVEPRPHPWLPIKDRACGYDGRLTDIRCAGCKRSRPESPHHQLQRLGLA